MKSFIYTISEHTPRNGHTVKTCRIYQILRGYPKLVAEGSDTYVDDFQLFMMLAEANKLLPRAAFTRHPMGGWEHYPAYKLRDDGFAKVTKVI